MNRQTTLDLSNSALDWCNYAGSERKYSVVLDGVVYMVKMPDQVREFNNSLSYMNNQFSEYVGCHIFESVGIPVQKTYLGKHNCNGKEVIVVACRDFQNDGIRLYPMKYIHMTYSHSRDIFSSRRGNRNNTIRKVYDLIHGLNDPELEIETIRRFWTVFAIDYLIANQDRHLEDWGMAKTVDGTRIPAPVYDCGSCLLPFSSDEALAEDMTRPDSFNEDSLTVLTPFSDETTGRRLSFRDIFQLMPADLEAALADVFPKINLVDIYRIIQETPFMSEIRKKAMMESIRIRYSQVLLRSYIRVVHKDLSVHEQNRIISRTKSSTNAALRKLGYTPLTPEQK